MSSAAQSVDALRIDSLVFSWRPSLPPCLMIPELRIAAGERVFIQGMSGSGKSTLLNLVAGVAAPVSGSLRLLGHELGNLGGAARDRLRGDHVGYIFQQFNLIPYLSAVDNVLLPVHFSARRRSRALRQGDSPRAAAAALLHRLDIDPVTGARVATQLSIGQQQRVAAARALIGAPEIVIADEPTSALDSDRQRAFLDLLMECCTAAGSALLFVSHDQRLAAGFDRQVRMEDLNRAARGPA